MPERLIEIKGVSKTFKALKAVNELSLTIHKGEYVALLGPNGAGKTTLIEMIEGIQHPDKGEITINGKSWKHHEKELHGMIGLSLQETKFIDKLTTEETLNLFASFYNLNKNRSKEILRLVNLESKKDTFTVNLSGGQRQRLALGIALLNNPEILLLDEPTTGLDPSARREIWAILEKLRKESGTTMILTTHYMEEAQYLCERILIMDQGKILAQGTLAELITSYGEGDVITFTLNQQADISFFNQLKGLKKIGWEEQGKKGKIIVANAATALPEFLKLLSANNINPDELESRKMTLDDLFISMTGRTLYE